MTDPLFSGAKGIRWDLTDLYSGIADPKIKSDLDGLSEKAETFERKFKGMIRSSHLTVEILQEMLRFLENLLDKLEKITAHAHLIFAGDSSSAENGKHLQSISERKTEIRNHLIFFELEWVELSDAEADRLLKAPALAPYRHYLSRERAYRLHRLAEGEEKILALKSNTGAGAFARLFDETLNQIEFEFDFKGEKTFLSEQEILGILYESDREKRMAAAKGLTGGLKENSRLLTYIFNVTAADHASDDRLRSFPDPAAFRHLSNEIEPEAVSALMASTEKNVSMVHRYYHLKKRLMKLEVLYDYDRYAPLFQSVRRVEWNEAREIVLSSFYAFSPEMGKTAQLFFDKKWIDAEIRPGKQGGAFSHGVVPSHHPYVLLNYTGNLRDVMTLAHELGHGVHQYLSRSQGYFHMDTPLTMAETASVFAEMLVFHQLKEKETNPVEKLFLIGSKCEEAFSTLFRQIVLTRFEEKLHDGRRERGELSTEELNRLWLEVNRPMFGDALQLTGDYGWWWMYISHFIHSPFYCYAYAFGELLVLSLYRIYLHEKPPFVSKYLKLLESGGSQSPQALLADFHIDLSQKTFWEGGLDLLNQMVKEAERLAEQVP
ncbi:MAG: M3 family oligoendopeptidase [Nitrospiria bacterium]